MVCFSCFWEPIFSSLALFNFLSRSLTLQRGSRGERQKPLIRLLLLVTPPSHPPLQTPRSHSFQACVSKTWVALFNDNLKGGKEGKNAFWALLKNTKAQNPYRWLWREMVALLVVEITIISCHAAGRCALGASNACVGAAVLRGGRVGGNRLSFCSWAGTSRKICCSWAHV